MSATLDTLKLAKRFRDAGASEQMAEAFAEAMRETQEGGLAQLATKADLETLRVGTKGDLREETLKLERRIDGLDNRIGQLENRLTIKLGGMMVVGFGVVAAFVKLL